MANRIAEIPDGDYGASLHLDADGVDPEGEFNVAVQIHIAGNRIRFSFDGTSPAAKGPINLPEIGAVGAVFTVLKGLILPHDPTNEGHFQDLEVELPPGLIVSPQRPSPTDSFGYVLNSLIELMLRALSEALPDRCPAGGLQMFGVGFNRVNPRDGNPFIYLEPLSGGNGGQPADDGPTMTIIGGGDVPNIPVEVMENRFPLQTTRLELFPEVTGAGMFRGGFGIRKDYRILESGIFLSFSTENTEDVLCRGMKGGVSGLPSAVVIAPGTDSEAVFKECVSYYGPLREGEIVSLRSGGGGGWGDPLKRDPERVLADVRNEFISVEEARASYGVTVLEGQDGWRVDKERSDVLSLGDVNSDT
jgi:N-methylhydantoinase B|tara:strand:- start:915 stop:1997 length:1083 start_codon:yes stop_codon:yes gene_type:complete